MKTKELLGKRSHPGSQEALRTWTVMTFAEDKTYQYIRNNHSNFCHIHVLEILPYLSCLTASDQDRLRASYERWGNQGTLWELFSSLRRRSGWVHSFIEALRSCEHSCLADEVARVYQSNLPRTPNQPPAPVEPPSVPAVAPSSLHNCYREDELSYPIPVQDTEPPESPGESSKKVPQSSSSGAVLKRLSGPPEPSSDTVALSPLPSGGPQEQDTEPGRTHTAGGAGDQAEGTICSSGAGVPTNSMIACTAPSKVPTNSALASTVPSKLPTSLKPTGTVPTNVLASQVPSKLPINAMRSGTVPPKVPAGLVPDHKKPTTMVPSRVPANTGPTVRSSNRPSEETPASPAPTGAVAGGTLPWPDSSSDRWSSEPELSKPGGLVSRMDSQPFSICSADLAISCSDSLGAGPDNAPEENEYVSMDTIRIHEGPSAPLLGDSPGMRTPPCAPEFQAEEELEESLTVGRILWAPWLGAAVAGALLATLLAVMYRRRLLQ
ncbi:mitochondrial antiviral-signaling protein [Camelus ferus]|nr:mitochondrial antiviral-signaling protein [Camelus ferus]